MRPLSVHSFQSWCHTLDNALDELPEHPEWSHDLYRSLLEVYRGDPLRIVLWTERDTPIGLIAFTIVPDSVWYPITEWLIPGFVGPCRCERIGEILGSVPLAAHATWWRMDVPVPPVGGRIHSITREETFGLTCDEPFEDHWSATGVLKDIRRSRKRCASLRLELDAPGAVEWVIERSAAYYDIGRITELQSRAQRVVTARLQEQGRLFSVSCSDGDRFVGGEIVIVHRNDAVSYMTFRDRGDRYAKLGVGNFLLAEVFARARAMQLGAVDLGGSFGYKKQWARPLDYKSTVTLGPKLVRLWHSGVRRVRRYGRPIYSLAARAGSS